MDRSTLAEQVHQALKQRDARADAGGLLAELQLVQARLSEAASNARQATNNVLAEALKRLAATHAEEAWLLSERFVKKSTVPTLTSTLAISQPTFYRRQKEAIGYLAEVIEEMEHSANAQPAEVLEGRLEPATYTRLFGMAHEQAKLLELLLEPVTEGGRGAFIVALYGIGGAGKTSLADAALRTAIRTGAAGEVAWVSARQERLDFAGHRHAMGRAALTAGELLEALSLYLAPQLPKLALDKAIPVLRAQFNRRPPLIVVDNLETVADLHGLLPVLQQLANPARFLLTTRYSLFGEPGIYHLPVPELNESDSLALIRLEASQCNAPELSTASDADLRPIFETVGGNPLALRLVVGQAYSHSLARTLDNLTAARGLPAENLYGYLYQAAWERLAELSRRVWLSMVLVAEGGGTSEHIARITEIPLGDVSSALGELVMLNLVDSRGTLQQRHYTIHSLTRTYLRTRHGRA